MTEVAFHFNVPDKLHYTCRRLRKARLSGVALVVTGQADFLQALDGALWNLPPQEFMAHGTDTSPPAVRRHSPVVLSAMVDDVPHHQVLVNRYSCRLCDLLCTMHPAPVDRNNLIDLVKIESNEVRWHLTRVDLRVLAEEMAGTLAPLVREKKLTLTIAQSGETPPVVSDPDRVRQVLANLLLNAITFSPIGGSIDVCTRHDGRVVRVFVRDHGVGIESDARIRIFERFKQVGDTLTEKPPGAGLGLPLSKGIIEHLGGEMAVHSRVGAGSTFVFSLPIDGPTDDDLKGHHRRPVVLLDDALAARD